jgi:HEAT repeat protein
MGTKRRIWLTAIGMAALAVLAWLVLPSNQAPEPLYKGEPLSIWLRRYEDPNDDTVSEQIWHREADEAVRCIGTNAIPTLLHLLCEKNSSLKTKLIHFLKNHPLLRIDLRSAVDSNRQAWEGFRVLGTNGIGAAPELVHIFQENISIDSQRFAISALGEIGDSAKSAIPALLQAATNTNYDWRVRCAALESINRIRADPTPAIPALASCLTDSNSYIRGWACVVIGNFGTNADPCVPALVPLLNDPGKLVRDAAGSALKKIDPEAAAKAGVK